MRYFLLCLLAISFTAKPIVIRHDVEDSEYKEFANSDNSTVTFYGIYKGEEVVAGTGAIIADRWVVTAAHVAKYLARSGKVQFKDNFYEIEDVVRHPLWQDQQFPNDIALVKLTSAIKNATIAKLYGSSNEKGKTATLVGRGDHGNGIDGVVGSDKALRAAKNVVTGVKEQWLQFVFDSGENALALEGISGPGDSGGPAFVTLHDSIFIIGVSSWQNTEATDWQEGKYGVIENYSRISYFKKWIEQTIEEGSFNKGPNTQTFTNKVE